MKTYYHHHFNVLFLVCLILSIVSCDKEIGNETNKETEELIENNPLEDVVNVTTTENVDELGFSYAVIKGSVNQALLSLDNDTYSFGIEIQDKETFNKQNYGTILDGQDFSVFCDDLSPNKEYTYRSFVKYDSVIYYGEYKKLTTNDFENITNTGEVSNIEYTTATVLFEVQENVFDKKESWNVGVAYCAVDSYQHMDSIEFDNCSYIILTEFDSNGCTCEVQLENLVENTTYAYFSLIKVGDEMKLGEIKSFATKSGWIAAGTALYSEDMVGTFFLIENVSYEVAVEKAIGNPAVIRLVDPYGAAYPYNAPGDYDTSKKHYMVFNMEDPEGVYFERHNSGMNWGYGEFTFLSLAGYYLEKGNPLEVIKGAGYCGTVVDNVITFPAGTLLVGMADYNGGVLYGAGTGAFKIDLSNATIFE